ARPRRKLRAGASSYPAADPRGAGAGERVARFGGQRALIADLRLLPGAHPLIGEAAPCPGVAESVVDIERGVEILDRLFVLAELGQALAAGEIGRGGVRIAVDRGVEIGDG